MTPAGAGEPAFVAVLRAGQTLWLLSQEGSSHKAAHAASGTRGRVSRATCPP